MLASKKPEIYYLVDLNKDKVPGTFYRAQLHKTEAPKDGEFFAIEKVLQTTTRKGQKMELVKFLGYPAKFNRWVPVSHMT